MLIVAMSLGGNIARARRAAGYENAAAFARLISVSPGTLGDWEAGRYKDLRLDNLLKIAKGAKCAIEDLVVGVDSDYDILRRDLLGHAGGTDSPPRRKERGSDVPAQARVQQLEGQLKERDVVIRQVQAVARRLLSIVLSTKDQTSRKRKARGRARDRAAS